MKTKRKAKKTRRKTSALPKLTRELFAEIEAAHKAEGELIEKLRGTWR